jgi:serine/alanine adding enzyme
MLKGYIYHKMLGSEWDQFVAGCDDFNAFQTACFFRMYEDSDNFEPYLCIVKDVDRDTIEGGFIFTIQRKYQAPMLRIFNRSLILGGPLLRSESAEVLHILMKTYNQFIGKKVIYSEIRNLSDKSALKTILASHKFQYNEHLNYQLYLKNANYFKAYSESKKRQIRKAIENGAKVIEHPSIDQLKEFYDILLQLYNIKIKKPLPSWSFFRSFYNNVIPCGGGKYLLIEYEKKIIGGIMIAIYKKEAAYEWYVAGMDKKYPKVYPSVLATAKAIEFAYNNRLELFDFMGAGVPEKYYGVREFKSKFGGKLKNYGRLLNKHNRFLFEILKLFKIIN